MQYLLTKSTKKHQEKACWQKNFACMQRSNMISWNLVKNWKRNKPLTMVAVYTWQTRDNGNQSEISAYVNPWQFSTVGSFSPHAIARAFEVRQNHLAWPDFFTISHWNIFLESFHQLESPCSIARLFCCSRWYSPFSLRTKKSIQEKNGQLTWIMHLQWLIEKFKIIPKVQYYRLLSEEMHVLFSGKDLEYFRNLSLYGLKSAFIAQKNLSWQNKIWMLVWEVLWSALWMWLFF